MRRRERGIDAQQDEHATAGPAGHDALQSLHGRLGKVRRKIGDDQNAVRLGHLAGKGIVIKDRLELVAEIDLDHVFHVLRQVGQSLLDVVGVGPDAAGDELLVEVGQVHEGGKVLAQAHRVEDRKADLARRHRRQQPQHRGLERLDGRPRPASPAFSTSSERSGIGKSNGRVNSVGGRLQSRVVGNAAANLGQLHVDLPETDGRRHFRGRSPRGGVGRAKIGKQPLATLADGLRGVDKTGYARVPPLGHLVPLLFVLRFAGGQCLLAGLAQGCRLGLVTALHLAEQGRVLRLSPLQRLVAGGLDRSQPRRKGSLDLGRLPLPPGKACAHRGEQPLVG